MDDTQGKVKNNIPSIYTASGMVVPLENPQPEHIKIGDIAVALSRLCRFTGHSRSFYSVAEHSIRVSRNLPEELRLTGLLHDATEAYLGDMSSPLKRLLSNYRELETRFWTAIATKYNLPDPLPAEVKQADYDCFVGEWANLMSPGSLFGTPKFNCTITSTMDSHQAYNRFVETFIKLS